MKRLVLGLLGGLLGFGVVSAADVGRASGLASPEEAVKPYVEMIRVNVVAALERVVTPENGGPIAVMASVDWAAVHVANIVEYYYKFPKGCVASLLLDHTKREIAGFHIETLVSLFSACQAKVNLVDGPIKSAFERELAAVYDLFYGALDPSATLELVTTKIFTLTSCILDRVQVTLTNYDFWYLWDMTRTAQSARLSVEFLDDRCRFLHDARWKEQKARLQSDILVGAGGHAFSHFLARGGAKMNPKNSSWVRGVRWESCCTATACDFSYLHEVCKRFVAEVLDVLAVPQGTDILGRDRARGIDSMQRAMVNVVRLAYESMVKMVVSADKSYESPGDDTLGLFFSGDENVKVAMFVDEIKVSFRRLLESLRLSDEGLVVRLKREIDATCELLYSALCFPRASRDSFKKEVLALARGVLDRFSYASTSGLGDFLPKDTQSVIDGLHAICSWDEEGEKRWAEYELQVQSIIQVGSMPAFGGAGGRD